MAFFRAVCLFSVIGSTAAAAWEDCDAKPSTGDGAFEHSFLSTVINETQLFVRYPVGTTPDGQKGWPAVIFMHALNLGYEWYQAHMERLASHGIVAVFPFIHSQAEDDKVKPAVSDTTGTNLEATIDILRKGVLPGIRVDMGNVALAGHNMGAVSALRIAAKYPKGTAKLVVAQHPFVCGIGPPPYPFTVSNAEITSANNNADLIYTTSEDDDAFGPWTPAREKSCFKNAQGSAIFVNFKESACEAFPDCKDVPTTTDFGNMDCKDKLHPFGKGHMCPTSVAGFTKWVSPEAQWLTTAVRTYLQHGVDSGSHCGGLLWGESAGSLSSDPNVADKVIQKKGGSSAGVVV